MLKALLVAEHIKDLKNISKKNIFELFLSEVTPEIIL